MKKTILLLSLSLLVLSTVLVSITQADSGKTDIGKSEASLYQRLGGYDAIVAVVNDLFPRLAGDKQLGRFWAHRGADGIAREKQLLIDFIANKAGGSLYYRGRDMKSLHVGMRISESDWRILMKHLHATLTKFKLAEREHQDVKAFIDSTKGDIVE